MVHIEVIHRVVVCVVCMYVYQGAKQAHVDTCAVFCYEVMALSIVRAVKCGIVKVQRPPESFWTATGWAV